MAVEVDPGRFTVGVFQDIAWAEKGIDALRKQGLAVESLSIIGKAMHSLYRPTNALRCNHEQNGLDRPRHSVNRS